VARWFADVADDEIFLSVLTVGEIRRGIDGIQRRDAAIAAA
jgi:toxin FitB